MKLTPQETAVGQLMINGYKNPEIAERLKVTCNRARQVVRVLGLKFQVPESKHPRICIVMELHRNRAQYGIKCQACGEM